MSADIITLDPEKAINNKKAICSTLPTGKFSSLLIRPETDLTISSIENKFDERFDDPSYYYGGAGVADGGSYIGDVVDGGDL